MRIGRTVKAFGAVAVRHLEGGMMDNFRRLRRKLTAGFGLLAGRFRVIRLGLCVLLQRCRRCCGVPWCLAWSASGSQASEPLICLEKGQVGVVLAHAHAAIHGQGCPGDKPCVIRCQKAHATADLFGFGQPRHGHHVEDFSQSCHRAPPSTIDVSAYPGAIALTVMPLAADSRARARVKPSTPALAAQ